MSTVITILIAVLVFGVIIFVHELGHFACAKWAGVRVNEFALGMGPTLWSFTKGETKYSLKAFPIGGFCAMEGEDEDSEDDRAFNKKQVWKRIVLDLAGAAMNLILGLIVVAVMVLMSGNVGTTTVSRFDEGNVSGQSGLQIGDEILRVNGTRTFIDNDIIYALLRDQDGVVDMQVRKWRKVDLPAVKFNMTEDADGNKLVDLDFKVAPTEKTFGSVVKQTFDGLSRLPGWSGSRSAI
ncbi:MAG: site-2 protease family protein [Oscillospiraceae bacterium]